MSRGSRIEKTPGAAASAEECRYKDCRDRILHAAITCFEKKGIHATSMADIARATPMSVGNLYNYFTGKEAIILELGVNEMRRFQAEAEQFMSQGATDVKDLVFAAAQRNLSARRAKVTVDFFSEATKNEQLLSILQQVDSQKRKLLLRMRRQAYPNESPEEAEIRVEVSLALMDGLFLRTLVHPKQNREAMANAVAQRLMMEWCQE